MSGRKPNNLPWVILGGIGGLLVLGLFGLGVYSGANAVSDEMAISLPNLSEHNLPVDLENVITIYVDETDMISVDGQELTGLESLKTSIISMDRDSLQATIFILRMNEKASHTSLISIKDFLDESGVQTKLQIVRSAAE